ncbi:MAG: hypothetical protein GX442_04605 [Candidatus Riflebacteria bacterium]|nr:hypothetical protein [Candidatus Riflebacteria bacterium]
MLGGLALLAASPAPAKPLDIKELQDIREEISLLNLLRGLYLSKDQVQKLMGMAQKLQALRQDLLGQIEADRTGVLGTFGGLRDALYEAPGQEKAAQEKASALDERFKEGKGALDDETWRLEREAETVLTAAQRAVIEGFKPCLIPPRDLKNPVRVGQAAAEAGILGKIADLIHAAPADLWQERGGRLLARLTDKLEEESGTMTPATKGDLHKRLAATAASIRALSDVDYNLRREDLAREMLLINPREALKHGHHKVGKIGQFLLSEAAARVLPRWIKAMDKMGTPPACDTEADGEGGPGGKDFSLAEAGAKALDQLQRMFRKRDGRQKLGAFPEFAAPVKAAIEAGDADKTLEALLACCDRLIPLGSGPDLTRAMLQLARTTARRKNLPLFNPKQDPFGLAEELKAVQDAPDTPEACAKARSLAGLAARFKGK